MNLATFPRVASPVPVAGALPGFPRVPTRSEGPCAELMGYSQAVLSFKGFHPSPFLTLALFLGRLPTDPVCPPVCGPAA